MLCGKVVQKSIYMYIDRFDAVTTQSDFFIYLCDARYVNGKHPACCTAATLNLFALTTWNSKGN